MKISVIIPVYNVEKYLNQCIDSVLGQTYRDLEIILVNDGSTDRSPEICEAYKNKDSRIKLIHKENGGLSDARNAGLQIATGDLVSFVDSDDFISINFYSKLTKLLIDTDSDITECCFIKFKTIADLESQVKETDETKVEIFEANEGLKGYLSESLNVVVWNKIYKKELLKDVLFPVNKLHEDVYWTYKIIAKAKRIAKIPDEMYYYRQHQESIMGEHYSLKRLEALQGLEEMLIFFNENFPDLQNQAIKTFCFGAMHHFTQLSNQVEIDPKKEYRKKVYAKVKNHNKWSIIKDWHWKSMVWVQIFLISPKLYKRMRDYYDAKSQRINQ